MFCPTIASPQPFGCSAHREDHIALSERLRLRTSAVQIICFFVANQRAGSGTCSHDCSFDPAVISSGSFGQIWAYSTPKSNNGLVEQFYSKPLVYTPSSTGRQVVLGFSEQNRIYVLDAVNGTLYAF